MFPRWSVLCAKTKQGPFRAREPASQALEVVPPRSAQARGDRWQLKSVSPGRQPSIFMILRPWAAASSFPFSVLETAWLRYGLHTVNLAAAS